MERHDVHELAAAYALHALDAQEEAEYEAHLSSCPACREQVSAFRETSALLAYGVEPAEPPAALRETILARARAERGNVVPLRPHWAIPAAASAAVAAAAALALGIWGVSLSSQLEREREARSSEEQALAIALDPQADRVPLEGADGILVISPDGQGALVLQGVEPPPEGRVYAAWVSADGERMLPAGTFRAGESRSVVGLTRPVPAGGLVAVTLEPLGGGDEPTGTPIIVAETPA